MVEETQHGGGLMVSPCVCVCVWVCVHVCACARVGGGGVRGCGGGGGAGLFWWGWMECALTPPPHGWRGPNSLYSNPAGASSPPGPSSVAFLLSSPLLSCALS